MDILTSVFTFCGNVSQTDTQYKVLQKKLQYELQKAEHLIQTQKIKNAPKFMVDNHHAKIKQAKKQLQTIQKLLRQDGIPWKQKIKLSLPFNKFNMLCKTAIEQLQKSYNDISQYGQQTQPQFNGKRSINDNQKKQKKNDIGATSVQSNSQVDDADIEEAYMGPTVEQDNALEFQKNQYIHLTVELLGEDKIIKVIKDIDPKFLVLKSKIQIKFQNGQKNQKKEVQELVLFSLGRLHFKPVYGKLKAVYQDIDRISKQGHFVIKLRRKRQNVKVSVPYAQDQMSQKQQSAQKPRGGGDVFFSFPSLEKIVQRQVDTIVVERAANKAVYCCDATGEWTKIIPIQKDLSNGEELAAWISPNKKPQTPDLYFKISYDIVE